MEQVKGLPSSHAYTYMCKCLGFLTPEPNGVGEGVYGIGRVLRRRHRRCRDGFSVWTP